MMIIDDDRGVTSLETAWGIGILALVASMVLGGMSVLGAYVSAIDQAGAAARSRAIGVPYATEGATVSYSESAGLTTATVSVPSVVGEISATAIFPTEHHG
jgi:hypothetical protein